MHLHKDSRSVQILKCLALSSGLILISVTSPMAGAQLIRMGIRSYILKQHFKKEKFIRDIKNLQTRKLIDYRILNNDKIEMTLTRQGRQELIRYELDDIKLKPQSSWDGKWRMIMFDIPHRHKKARDALRQKLKELGFYPIQKSVFIVPHPCKSEINFITSVFGVQKYILMFELKDFEGEEKLKNYFKI